MRFITDFTAVFNFMLGGDYYRLYYKNPTCCLNLPQLSDVYHVSLHYSLLQLFQSPLLGSLFASSPPPMRGQIAKQACTFQDCRSTWLRGGSTGLEVGQHVALLR